MTASYRIINVLDGFENAYNEAGWQLWRRDDCGGWGMCGVFFTRSAARNARDYYEESEA